MGQLKNLDRNISVVTSTYVIKEGKPILYVSNENDEEGRFFLQFHCDNDDYDMDKMLLVKLDTVLKLDEGLGKLNLEVGEEARRANKISKWKILEP